MKQHCPPEMFGLVESGIYRSNALSPINFPFIKQLNLKTVLQLSPEVPIKAVSTFFQENQIEHVFRNNFKSYVERFIWGGRFGNLMQRGNQ